MFDLAQPSIAVAYVVDSQGRLLLNWNDKWGAFTLPMTKLHSSQPAETPEQAGVRAAAEILGVPARVVPGKAAKFARGLQKSPRDGDIKLQTGEYQPVSKSVEALLRECVEWGCI